MIFLKLKLFSFQIKQSNVKLWYYRKLVLSWALFLDLQGLIEFIVNYKRISMDIETDSEASSYVISLFIFGILRTILISLALYSLDCKLDSRIQSKSLHPNIFGSVFTFFADFLILELYFYTSYLYSFSLPLVLIISVVSYVYYKHIRL